MKSKVILLIYFLFLSLCLQAQTFKEIWYNKTPVSGDIRVGIINEISDEFISPSKESYYAFIDTSVLADDLLCTVISSRDGRYKAEISRTLTSIEKGEINRFDWNSKYIPELSKMKKSEITMISFVAETCDSEPKYYTLSQWNKDVTEKLFFLLNSEKKPYVKIELLEVKGKPKETLKCTCQKLEGETNVNYNYICDIPVEKIIDRAYKITVVQKVVRISNMTSVPYPVNLRLPNYE